MKRKRFPEEQIIGVLREQKAGAKAGDLARRHAVSDATLYNWKAKYGGMDVSDAKRLKALDPQFLITCKSPLFNGKLIPQNCRNWRGWDVFAGALKVPILR